jgi:signal transduction histidine kinase
MSAETRFYNLTFQLRNLLDCGTVNLLIGCPEPQLRHPLLDLFPINSYRYAGSYGESNIDFLLKDEKIRALCDLAVQSGQVQSTSDVQMHSDDFSVKSIAVAPLEGSGGLLGLFLLTDPHSETFSYGERLLLSSYIRIAAKGVEQVLRNLHIDVQDQRDEFISMIGHELRTPLTSIKGYAALLQAYGAESSTPEMTPARQREYLNTIIEQVDHLEVLISDLLDMSHIHTGRLTLRFTEFDVALLCRQMAELAQQQADRQQAGRYDIRCLLDAELPPVLADPDRVQQVLTNLLGNAIKYSPGGGRIEILASQTHISFSSNCYSPSGLLQEALIAPVSPMVYITVRDWGFGIAHEQLSLLFKPFSRLEHAVTNQIPGAGLGLYITHKLVEAMNGHVIVCSIPDQGTSVTFTLPASHS